MTQRVPLIVQRADVLASHSNDVPMTSMVEFDHTRIDRINDVSLIEPSACAVKNRDDTILRAWHSVFPKLRQLVWSPERFTRIHIDVITIAHTTSVAVVFTHSVRSQACVKAYYNDQNFDKPLSIHSWASKQPRVWVSTSPL